MIPCYASWYMMLHSVNYPTLDMLCLIYDLWHRYTVFTPTLDMLHLIYDLWHRHLVFTPAHGIWHRYFSCYIWHRYLPCYIWHRYLPCYMWYVIPDTGTCHAIFDIWYPTLVLVMLHLSLDIRHRYLICHTWHLLLTPGIWYAFMWYKYLDLTSWLLTGHYHPDTCVLYDIFMTITVTGTWHDYYIITRYLVLLNSCTPELLYTWTPEIGRLLTLLLILYSCWPP